MEERMFIGDEEGACPDLFDIPEENKRIINLFYSISVEDLYKAKKTVDANGNLIFLLNDVL